MNYFHVHLKVKDLAKSIAFYNALFNQETTLQKGDYAKWQLEEPRVNFAISTAAEGAEGIEHLGLQAESSADLQQLYAQIEKAEGDIREEGKTICCYAQSEKSWIEDPQGVSWEVFHIKGEATVYGTGEHAKKAPASMESWADNEKSAAPSCC